MWAGVKRFSELVDGCDPNSAALFFKIWHEADNAEYASVVRQKQRERSGRDSITNHNTQRGDPHRRRLDETREKHEELYQLIALLGHDDGPSALDIKSQLRNQLFPSLDERAPGFADGVERYWTGVRAEDEICRAVSGAARTMLAQILGYARAPPAGGLACHPWVASNAFPRRREPDAAAAVREPRGTAAASQRPRDSLDLGTLQGKLDNAKQTLALFEQMGEAAGVSHIRGEIAELEAAIAAKSHPSQQRHVEPLAEPPQVDSHKLSLLMTITGCTMDQARTCLDASQGDVEAAASMLVQ